MENLAPILLFTYNRLNTLKQTVGALQKNHGAIESDLYIFSDAAKYPSDQIIIAEIRGFIKNIDGFKSITIVEAQENKGLAKSIISGVDMVINKLDKVIVLEDDLITSENFLVYMNQALKEYKENRKVFSISGYTTLINNYNHHDVYFTNRASSWGWATWKNRWEIVDWSVSDYEEFKNHKIKQKEFNSMGSDLCKMLKDQMTSRINSWAIRWVYSQFKHNLFTVYPTLSKVRNIGTDGSASNTKDRFNRFETLLDETNKKHFFFPNIIETDKFFLDQFLKQFSILTRLKFKLLNKLFS